MIVTSAIKDAGPIKSDDEKILSVKITKIDNLENHLMSPAYADWTALFKSDPHASIYQHPDFVLNRFHVRHELIGKPIYLIKCWREKTICGLAILIPHDYRYCRMVGLDCSFPIQGFRLAGNRLLGSEENDVHSALLDGIGKLLNETNAEYVLIEDFDTSDSLWKLIHSRPNEQYSVFSPSGIQKRHRIVFPSEISEYWSRLSKNARKQFRRTEKKFGRFELMRFTQADEIRQFLELAHKIALNSWQYRYLGLRVRNDDDEYKLYSFLAKYNAFRGYVLFKDNSPVAFVIDTIFNGYVNSEEGGV